MEWFLDGKALKSSLEIVGGMCGFQNHECRLLSRWPSQSEQSPFPDKV